jgi:8-amino-7-oxononanoate synthase
MRLSRAQNAKFPHNDVGAAEDAIRAWREKGGTGRIWIVVESLYSMDGDKAPLDDLFALAARHDAFLLIDEAHATGVYGPGGHGLAARFEGAENIVTLHTCGKALGVAGGLLCLPRVLRDFMVNRCRSFIFATAPSPVMAACVRAALKIIEAADDRRAELMSRIDFAGAELRRLCAIEPSGSQIQPVIRGRHPRDVLAACRRRMAMTSRHSSADVPDGCSLAHRADAACARR